MNSTVPKIRVLVVDDSVVMRRIITEAISSDPELEVAAYAANGEIALRLIEQGLPDVVTLDIEMPLLDGLATLKQMRARRCYVPVIMFSTLTERGAEATIESLALGASDYVTKPVEMGGYDAARQRIAEALIPKIKALCRAKKKAQTTIAPIVPAPFFCGSKHPARVDVLAIGCSTGGPNALAQLLPAIPRDFPVPVLVVQHMPPTFTRFLAQRLGNLCQLPVREAGGGEFLRPGTIWIAPGGFHLCVQRELTEKRLAITEAPPENSCRPSVDVLFRSVCRLFGSNSLAVVLTGMGQDGLRGCELLAAAGAQIVVQDEVTSVVWGMPGFVAKAGLADAVVPISGIAEEILKRVALSRAATTTAGAAVVSSTQARATP